MRKVWNSILKKCNNFQDNLVDIKVNTDDSMILVKYCFFFICSVLREKATHVFAHACSDIFMQILLRNHK